MTITPPVRAGMLQAKPLAGDVILPGIGLSADGDQLHLALIAPAPGMELALDLSEGQTFGGFAVKFCGSAAADASARRKTKN